MKKIGLVLIGLMLLLNFSGVFGEAVNFHLVGYARYPSNSAFYSAIAEKQLEPMNEAFGFEIDTTPFLIAQKNDLRIRMNLAIPTTPLQNYRYSVYRDGEELNEINGNVLIGDQVTFTPTIGEISDHGNDWISQGASQDSPPIELLPKAKYFELESKLRTTFMTKYPFSSFSTSQQSPESVPALEIEKTDFDERKTHYTAKNGYTAYVVPLMNGRKAGVQVFCTSTLSTPTTFSCTSNETGSKVVCEVKKETEKGVINLIKTSACMIYIDKVIFEGKAAQADWLAPIGPTYSLNTAPLTNNASTRVQAIPKGMETPIPKLHCSPIEEKGTAFYDALLCDASASIDPDGEIINYGWVPNYSMYCYSRSPEGCEKWETIVPTAQGTPITLALTVTDNDGIYSTLTRTIQPEGDTMPILFASYNEETKNAEIDLECTEETATLYIDKMNDEGELVGSEIESVSIPCNQISEVGPIVGKGGYQATVQVGEFEEIAIFTVD